MTLKKDYIFLVIPFWVSMRSEVISSLIQHNTAQ